MPTCARLCSSKSHDESPQVGHVENEFLVLSDTAMVLAEQTGDGASILPLSGLTNAVEKEF